MSHEKIHFYLPEGGGMKCPYRKNRPHQSKDSDPVRSFNFGHSISITAELKNLAPKGANWSEGGRKVHNMKELSKDFLVVLWVYHMRVSKKILKTLPELGTWRFNSTFLIWIQFLLHGIVFSCQVKSAFCYFRNNITGREIF